MRIRTRHKDAYHELREAIVTGRFQPNERLVEATVAERLGVGRTAVRAALVRLDQEGLVVLERTRGARVRLIEGRDALGYSELNARFHQRIWEAADHPTASRLVGGLKSQSIRFQFQTALRPGRAERSLHEHEAIVEALRRGDPDAAESAMRGHLAEVLDTLRWAIHAHSQSSGWIPA